jgi:CRISPR-associated protein Cas4
MESDEGLYHATPQTQGRIAHETVDEKKGSTSKDVIFALPVYSEKYRLMEKVDVYKTKEKCLIERKYQLKQIYQGQMFAEAFTGADSIMIIEGSAIKVMKYGNAIHRDQDVVFF